jgi:Tfp pilus assembly major pilin PilA
MGIIKKIGDKIVKRYTKKAARSKAFLRHTSRARTETKRVLASQKKLRAAGESVKVEANNTLMNKERRAAYKVGLKKTLTRERTKLMRRDARIVGATAGAGIAIGGSAIATRKRKK